MHIAESEKIKKTFAFNVDIFNRRKIYRFYLHSGYVFAIIYRHDLRGQYALRKETMKGGLYCEG